MLPGLTGFALEPSEQSLRPVELGRPDRQPEQDRWDRQRPGQHRQGDTGGDAEQAGQEYRDAVDLAQPRLLADPLPPAVVGDRRRAAEWLQSDVRGHGITWFAWLARAETVGGGVGRCCDRRAGGLDEHPQKLLVGYSPAVSHRPAAWTSGPATGCT